MSVLPSNTVVCIYLADAVLFSSVPRVQKREKKFTLEACRMACVLDVSTIKDVHVVYGQAGMVRVVVVCYCSVLSSPAGPLSCVV